MSFHFPTGVLAQHVIGLGKTGAGKSSAMRFLVEGLLDADKPVCIIDPKGDWWGIKSSADGKKAGYPIVVFGGEHADVPINAVAGAEVAELIATGNRSCLIDLRGWTVADRTRFFMDFASTVFKRSKGARHLVIDEVHLFAPQGKILNPDAGKMLHWANRLATEGRGLGLTILAASQRPQKVHKDFLTSCETLIAMRVIHKLDRDAIKDWIDGCADPTKGKEVIASLAQMKRGEAWVWSPEIEYGPERITFPLFKTYDSFKPQAADAGKLKGWADVDLEEVKAKLAAVVEQHQANDPAILKRRIAELERQVRAVPEFVDLKTDPAFVELQDQAYQSGVQECVTNVRKWFEGLTYITEALTTNMADFNAKLKEFQNLTVATRAPAPRTPPMQRAVEARNAATKAKVTNGGGNGHDLTSVGQKILNALAELEQMGAAEPERELLAFMAGYSHINSKGFATAMSDLRTQGLIDGSQLTQPGRAAAQPPPRPRTPAELQDRIISLLGGASARVLRPLLDAYPKGLERQALAAAAGYSHINSKGFALAMGRMRTLGFIDTDRGAVMAKPLLFLE